jgi:ADP-heptose:LPS heptosyltransferase
MTTRPQSILIDHSGAKGIGDIICELNAYAALRSRFPNSHLVSRGSRTLAWGNPYIDAFDESSPDEAFDQVVRLGIHWSRLKDSLSEGLSIFDHVMRANGLDMPSGPPQLHVLPAEVDAIGVEPDHPDDLLIAYSVDSKEPDRRWGEERFAELLQYIQETYGGTYLELGSGFTAGHVGIGYDLVGQTDLRQTMALLSEADLFIGNHGGLTHLAGGVGTPILCPWGASNPYRAYAYDAMSEVIETAPDCRYCAWTSNVTQDCQATSVFRGRTACTQTISVSQMREAADRLIFRLRLERERLRSLRHKRRQVSKDPRRLLRFDRPETLDPYTNMRLFIGGTPGWGPEHRNDHYARLRKIVAFPDWHNPASAWDSLVSSYVSFFDADDPWVLILSAAPHTGPAVHELLDAYLRGLDLKRPSPKVMLIFGSIGETERRDLIQNAEAYVPLAGPYHLDGVESARYVTHCDELAALA